MSITIILTDFSSNLDKSNCAPFFFPSFLAGPLGDSYVPDSSIYCFALAFEVAPDASN